MTTQRTPAAAKAPHRPRPQAVRNHEIRIIGGHWKRIRLKVADRPGLRPTPDRVRETLFNWLGQDLQGLRCVDAFAGTGALGFEAASRGAREVLLVEQDRALVEQLQQVRAQLLALELPEPLAQIMQVQRGDGVSALRQLPGGSQDVLFLDPPFDTGLHQDALAAAARALAPNGSIYLESPTAWTDALLEPLGLQVHRHLKAGSVHAHIVRAVADATPAGQGQRVVSC